MASINDDAPEKGSMAAELIRIAKNAELFRSPEGKLYSTVPVENAWLTYELASDNYKHWLNRQYYNLLHRPANSRSLQEAIDTLSGMARFGSAVNEVFIRVGSKDEKLYIDLGDDTGRAVEISRDGWSVISRPPVKFRRTKGMLPLPEPVKGGSVMELGEHVNLKGDDLTLAIGWILAALRPTGPYPILVENGAQGSSKSTTAKMLRALVDPSHMPLRSEARNVQDLMIAADNSWVLAFDNVSRIGQDLSDGLCRIATGGAMATRKLYSNNEEAIHQASRPVLLNGITDLLSRGDLIERALVVSLPAIPENQRKVEREIWKKFEDAQPRILGGLYDGLACALRLESQTTLPKLPRLADLAIWVTAAEPALGWNSGTFLEAHSKNQESANGLAIESSPVAQAILENIGLHSFEGTAAELLDELNEWATPNLKKQRQWPSSPKALKSEMQRLVPVLKKEGLEISFSQTSGALSRKLIKIASILKSCDASDAGTDKANLMTTQVSPRRGLPEGFGDPLPPPPSVASVAGVADNVTEFWKPSPSVVSKVSGLPEGFALNPLPERTKVTPPLDDEPF